MADVITLDGLESTKIGATAECGRLVTIRSPVLNQDVQVCEVDVQRLTGKMGALGGRRKVGRPRGSTVARGAKKPRLKACKVPRKVRTKRGRTICQCSDDGNRQILPNSRCGIGRAKEK